MIDINKTEIRTLQTDKTQIDKEQRNLLIERIESMTIELDNLK